MADQADVEVAIASIVANALYPNGTAAESVVGNICRVYRGYPTAPSLDKDLAAGVVHVSVTASAAPVKNVTRYPRQWVSVTPVLQLLGVAMSGQTASFSGDCAVGQLVGAIVNEAIFPYAVQAHDSPATVASNLAAIVRSAGWLVEYSGQSISVPGADRFLVRVVAGAGSLQEVKRQTQDFRITMWCPDPVSRDAVAPVIDEAMLALNFVPLADGSFARLIFADTAVEDNAADATLYRRDITYHAEYPTTITQFTPAMLFGTANISANSVFVERLQA